MVKTNCVSNINHTRSQENEYIGIICFGRFQLNTSVARKRDGLEHNVSRAFSAKDIEIILEILSTLSLS